MAVGTMTSKGQITVPKEIREALGLRPGDRLRFELEGEDLRVRRQPDLLDFAGAVDVPEHLRGRPWSEIESVAHEEAARRGVTRGREDAG